jgi:hypothetical protein
MRPFAFDSWIGLALAVVAVAALSALLLPSGLAVKGLGLMLALAALAVSVVLQVRSGRRSTWQVIQDVDHEPAPVAARALSGTIDLSRRRAR